MKKRAVGLQHHGNLWPLKGGLALIAGAFILIMFKLHAQFRPQSNLNYENFPQTYSGKPKVAFLFLARHRLPLDFAWQHFFEGAEEPNFSIYIHARPGFVYNEITTTCTFFHGRQISDSIQVGWGESSMIEAERILLRRALADPANQIFILLSDSCVPLYNFSYVYDYVMSSPKSFVDSFLDPKGERYNLKMAPVIPKNKWRKGSQWVTLVRKHAEIMAADNTIFPVFKRHCKRRAPLPEHLRKQAHLAVVQKEHNCIPDEHYVQTLLAMRGLEDELEHRTLTYTSWNQSKDEFDTQGWHPRTFKYTDVDAKLVESIKGIDNVYYPTEYRTEWCSRNGTQCPCFLFARKFSRGGAIRLLNHADLDHHFRMVGKSQLRPLSLSKANATSQK
uniref:TSA: Wollemia nobilis Ref_Wollemi_Transcript_1531_1796 transcribed RNA sequence n=1 Tax=Wollemia nobilis TaxID=56998 RepID=A0A0C9QXB9_9CONI